MWNGKLPYFKMFYLSSLKNNLKTFGDFSYTIKSNFPKDPLSTI